MASTWTSWTAAASIAALTACGSLPSAAPPPTGMATQRAPAASAPPLPPLAPSLVAASNELAEALRASGDLRLRRIARARGVIESIVGRPAVIAAADKLPESRCGLARTILAASGQGTEHGIFARFEGKLLRFDPEMKEIAASRAPAVADDPPGIDPARFVWVSRALVDVEAGAIVPQPDMFDGVIVRSPTGRLRVVGKTEQGAEARSLPSGKLLFLEPGLEPFVDGAIGVAGGFSPDSDPTVRLVMHDLDDGREIRRFDPLLRKSAIVFSVAVSPDRSGIVVNAFPDVLWVEKSGRRVERWLGDSFFDAPIQGPYFTHDGKHACGNYHGKPVELPTGAARDAEAFCAFTPQTLTHHREAVMVTPKREPPWSVLRGPGVTGGNAVRMLGGWAASSDRRLAAVIETEKPMSNWLNSGRLRVVEISTGTTVRTWPLEEGNMLDVAVAFVDGDSAVVVDGTRYVLADGSVHPVTVPDVCAAVSWLDRKVPLCVIGPILGPAALCEGAAPSQR